VGVVLLIALVAVVDAVLLPARKPSRSAPNVTRTIGVLSLDLAAFVAFQATTSLSPVIAAVVSVFGGMLLATAAGVTVLWAFGHVRDPRIAGGLVIAEWPEFVVAAVAGVLASTAGVLVAISFAAGGFGSVWLIRHWLIQRRESSSPTDEELLDAIEFALLERVDTTIGSR
jgi:hypothetical protein